MINAQKQKLIEQISEYTLDELLQLNKIIVMLAKQKRNVVQFEKQMEDGFKVGMRVKFRRNTYEAWNTGVITKMNRVKAKVQVMSGPVSARGQQWNVPFTMMEAA